MIYIENKREKAENIRKRHPWTRIVDVTSTAEDEFRRLSPFYPYGDIPIPFSDGMTATCVEAVWQGLKVFEGADVDMNCFRNDTMQNLKRTVRRFGRPLGHRKGVHGTELLNYMEARRQIYIPTYKWMLEHKAMDLVFRLREMSAGQDIVLLDYNTNGNVDDPKKPLSHAYLVKAYVEGLYPYGGAKNETTTISSPGAGTKATQLELFDYE